MTQLNENKLISSFNLIVLIELCSTDSINQQCSQTEISNYKDDEPEMDGTFIKRF